MEVEKLKTLLEPIFSKHEVVLYSMSWKKQQQDRVLEILVYKKDIPTDLETCVKLSNDISALMDDIQEIDFAYLLDISSAGIEREILNEQQLHDILYHYVNVKVDKPVDGLHVIEGKLSNVTSDSIDVLYRIKHKEVKATIEKSNIRKIRMAVKV